MTLDFPQLLADAHRIAVVAPAGCGKTESIARAVKLSTKGRQLILTHTHAGVRSLRNRLKKLGVPGTAYHVDTIDGWAYDTVRAYPQSSGMGRDKLLAPDFADLSKAASNLTEHSFFKRVVAATYSGLYVDEYQDCTLSRHNLIVRLAEILPTRILGDPLQGIFGFGSRETLIDWESDVTSYFKVGPEMTTPYRWNNAPDLAVWLTQARHAIQSGQSLKVPDRYFKLGLPKDQSSRKIIGTYYLSSSSTTVAIHWNSAAPDKVVALFTCILGKYSRYSMIEDARASAAVELVSNSITASSIFDFGSTCFRGFTECLSSENRALKSGKGAVALRRIKKRSKLTDILIEMHESAADTMIGLALKFIRQVDELERQGTISLFRPDLWDTVRGGIALYQSGGLSTLVEAVQHYRRQSLRAGRMLPHRLVSTTLLVKGLEFDNTIVVGAESFDAKNLYVALTRPRQRLLVVASSQVLEPKFKKASQKPKQPDEPTQLNLL